MESHSIQSIAAMANVTLQSKGLYHSMTVFESASIGLATWTKVHQTGIELDAEAELPDAKAISKMWQELLDSVSYVMDSSQELNVGGKWDLHVLFVEYKVFSRSGKYSGVDYENLLLKVIKVLHMLSEQFDELEALIVRARRSETAVYSSLYSSKKRQELVCKQRGLTQWLVSHFRGNRVLLKNQQQLDLTRVAIERTAEVSKYLGEIEMRVKLYKDNIITIHDSIRLEQAQGCRKLRASLCLVFLESIFHSPE
ncbi:hypothetical protein PCASD_22340 [Puccinia coronata f. sp. avenae]|uniref:Uncharacterized protein n=1 Tax=Puccinia coronata f. sp. avenae TaxID=200324 RepID=A0A2N5U8C0_9BASI|nr:hypothetical protein PCASD_22340 [Puccinia coronata f. sp. avenae]